MTRSLEGHGRAGFLSCHVEICSHQGSQPQKKVKTLLVHTLVRRQVLQPHQNKISNLNISSNHFHFLNLKVKHRFYRQELKTAAVTCGQKCKFKLKTLHLGSRGPGFRESWTILIQTLNQPKYRCYQMILRTLHNHVVALLVDEQNAISSNPFSRFMSLSGTAGSPTHHGGVCYQNKRTETGRSSSLWSLLHCFKICDHAFAALTQDNQDFQQFS